MTKRHIALIALVLACFTGAQFALVYSQEEARIRSAANIETLCQELEGLTGMPCALRTPPSGVLDARTTRPHPIVGDSNVPFCPTTRPVWGTADKKYHTPDSPYRDMVKRPIACFETEQEARDADYVKAGEPTAR